jgi:hypothetical protein
MDKKFKYRIQMNNNHSSNNGLNKISGYPFITIYIIHKLITTLKNNTLLYRFIFTIPVFTISLLSVNIKAYADTLYVGTSTVDITPELPVALDGQMHLRIAREVGTPLEANIAVLESRHKNKLIETTVFVSCDLVVIPSEMLYQVKYEVHKLLPGFNTDKIVMNAIHTHTAPVVRANVYPIPEKDVTQIEDYYSFFAKKIGRAIKQAWDSRKPGNVTWGLSQAKVGYNRRAVYADNSAKMYGKTNIPEFRGIEGYEDQNVNSLFFWDKQGELIAVGIAVACPAQEVEERYEINADYWHPVRLSLRKRFNSRLCVLGWIGAAGDQSPHLMYGKAGEERMRNLRHLSRLDEIARRIVFAVEDTYEVVKTDRHNDIQLIHETKDMSLPMRLITKTEYKASQKEIKKLEAQINADPKAKDRLFRKLNSFEGDVIRRYEQQKIQPAPMYNAKIHVIRIGDIVICTNPFELFTDYSIAIQARSKAVQTFVVQLAGPGTYLPTEKAVKGGHYSAIAQSNLVGPEGGQLLVDQTVELINKLWNVSYNQKVN